MEALERRWKIHPGASVFDMLKIGGRHVAQVLHSFAKHPMHHLALEEAAAEAEWGRPVDSQKM